MVEVVQRAGAAPSRSLSTDELFVGWVERTRQEEWNIGERDYLERSLARFRQTLTAVEDVVECTRRPGEPIRLLDIGPHLFTRLLRERFPDSVINTLGYENPRLCPREMIQEHLTFDLNDAQEPGRWPKSRLHDVVVAGEVIEHLYTAPTLVLRFLKSLLAPGGRLVVTTPNALAVTKRLKLVLGTHPYEMLRETRENPGHIREYTSQELIDAGGRAGLKAVECRLVNSAPSERRSVRYLYSVASLLPQLRDSMIIVYAHSRS